MQTADSVLYRLDSILEPIDPTQLFPRAQPLEVELGSGDGSFLAEYARSHPEHNFIGVERLLGRIRKLARKASRARLLNLRGIRIEASYFISYLLPRRCVNALHIYFPDPWPKRKHERHRLINESFPAVAARTLAAGGSVFLRTDSLPYFEQMQRVFQNSGIFAAIQTPPELARVTTDFETEFQARQIPTLRAAYQHKG